MTVSDKGIGLYLQCMPGAADIALNDGLRMQIVPTMAELAKARIAQCGAFIADQSLLVVWDDDPRNLVTRAEGIVSDVRRLVWNSEKKRPHSSNYSPQTDFNTLISVKRKFVFEM